MALLPEILKYGNRVKVQALAAPGIGNFFIGAPVTGYQTFAAAISSLTTGDEFRYVIEDGANWEIGRGVYNSTGPQFTRIEVIQSSAGPTSLINATASAVAILSVASSDFVKDPDSTFTGSINEKVYALTGTTPAINARNGTIQDWVLTGTSYPTDSLSEGQSVTMMITAGDSYTIIWPTVAWKSDFGFSPNLNTSGVTAVVLWKVNSILYGARVGNA